MRITMLLLVICVLGSCGLFSAKLTEQDIQRYIRAQQQLNRFGIQAGNENLSGAAQERVTAIIRDAGFKDLAGFMQVTAKIGAAMSLIQSLDFIGTLDETRKEGLSRIDEALADPATPAETKAELRTSRAAIIAEWEKNSKYAQPVLNITQSLVDEQTRALVQKYEPELLQVYSGGAVEGR